MGLFIPELQKIELMPQEKSGDVRCLGDYAVANKQYLVRLNHCELSLADDNETVMIDKEHELIWAIMESHKENDGRVVLYEKRCGMAVPFRGDGDLLVLGPLPWYDCGF